MEKNFVIFLTSELSLIDFTEVLENSAESCRLSIDGTKTFVKWFGNVTPPCILLLTTIVDYYTYDELLQIVSTSTEWNVF